MVISGILMPVYAAHRRLQHSASTVAAQHANTVDGIRLRAAGGALARSRIGLELRPQALLQTPLLRRGLNRSSWRYGGSIDGLSVAP